MKRVDVRARSAFQEMDAAPSDLPVDEGGLPLPLELAMLLHFRAQRGGTVAEDGPSEAGDQPKARIDLPSLPRAAVSTESVTETLLFDASRPARYFCCRTNFDLPIVLETRFVYRDGAQFIIFASYLVRPPGTSQSDRPFDCYHFGTAPCDSKAIETTVKSIARQEIDDFMHMRRGPSRAHLGDVAPLLRLSTAAFGGGTLLWERDPRKDTTTITLRNSTLDALPRDDKRRVREDLEAFLRRIRLPSGDDPAYDPEALRGVLVSLATICDDLLERVKDDGWPPFGTHRSIDRFVEQNFRGDPVVAAALADSLKDQERRPSSGRDLAVRVLATATGLSRDRLRRLSRV